MFKFHIGQVIYFVDLFTDELRRGIFRGIESVHKKHEGWTQSVPYMVIDPLEVGEDHHKPYDPESDTIVRVSSEIFDELMRRYLKKIRGKRVFVKPRVTEGMLPDGVYIAFGHNRFG